MVSGLKTPVTSFAIAYRIWCARTNPYHRFIAMLVLMGTPLFMPLVFPPWYSNSHIAALFLFNAVACLVGPAREDVLQWRQIHSVPNPSIEVTVFLYSPTLDTVSVSTYTWHAHVLHYAFVSNFQRTALDEDHIQSTANDWRPATRKEIILATS